MFAVLRHYGISQSLVNAIIQVLYSNSSSAVTVEGSTAVMVDEGVFELLA